MRTIVLIGGGIESIRGIDVARRLGYRVAVVDGDRNAPGIGQADEAIIVSTYDVEEVVNAILGLSTRCDMAGVTSVATDVPVTVASAAERLGTPGLPITVARRSADKLIMKERFVASGIPTARFWPVRHEAELRSAVAESDAEEFVLKPVDSRGARGVLRVRRTDDLAARISESMSHSQSRRCILEEFELGPQISSEGYFTPDWHETPGFADRNYARLESTYPYMIEDGGESPSRATHDVVEEASALAVRAARALGAQQGIVKGDLVLTPDGPKVIEIALRLSGGWFCTHQIPLLTGVDLVEAAIRTAVGETVDRDMVRPKISGGIAIRYYFPAEGTVTQVPAPSAVQNMPGVSDFGIYVQVGDRTGSIRNHTARAGHVITVGSSRDEAVERAEAVISSCPIEVDRAPVHA